MDAVDCVDDVDCVDVMSVSTPKASLGVARPVGACGVLW
jgi:hypothetical protein